MALYDDIYVSLTRHRSFILNQAITTMSDISYSVPNPDTFLGNNINKMVYVIHAISVPKYWNEIYFCTISRLPDRMEHGAPHCRIVCCSL